MTAMQSAMMVQTGASISEAAGTDGMDHGNSVVCLPESNPYCIWLTV
jgi:hypothetical protein